MRLALDATPLIGPRTGVGRYVGGLLSGLAELELVPDIALVPVTWRRHGAVDAPAGPWRVAGHRAPARLLRLGWSTLGMPPIEWVAGEGSDVFHATNFVLPPTRRAAGVVTVHDLAYLRMPETVRRASAAYRHLVPQSLRRAGAVCTVSHAVREELLATYEVDPARVVVTPNGVGPEWAAARALPVEELARLGLPRHYLLFSGSLEPRKGIPTLLQALRLLRADGVATPPVVLAGPAGWGPPPDLTGLPADAVLRTGPLPEAAVCGLTAGASALVYPSRYEGFGLPPLEALAAGTPVVCSDLPVLREVCGELAAYFPVQDAAALARCLEEVVRTGDGGPSARAARRAHAAPWTWRRCAERSLDAYNLAYAG